MNAGSGATMPTTVVATVVGVDGPAPDPAPGALTDRTRRKATVGAGAGAEAERETTAGVILVRPLAESPDPGPETVLDLPSLRGTAEHKETIKLLTREVATDCVSSITGGLCNILLQAVPTPSLLPGDASYTYSMHSSGKE